MKTWKIYLFGFILVMAGCAKKVDFNPRPINYDRDVCYVCKMGLDNPKYNVQAINERGEIRWYDDIGCLAEDMRDGDFNKWKGNKYKIWIGDANTGKWIDAEKAWYRYGDDTPMGYGYGALAQKPDTGEVYDFKTTIKRIDQGLTKRKEFIKKKKMSMSGGENQEGMKCGGDKCGGGKCGGGKCGGGE
ncbi:MAG: hypothetical protein GXO24_01830 [Chlorobi bacterium]|nr:hypothetical protein [Chlorobiota bacterium]